MRRALAGTTFLLSALLTRPAHGEGPAGCASPTRPVVLVVAPPDLPGPVSAFVALLRAELASRNIDVCLDSNAPIATVEVATKPGAIALTVDVRDAITAKRVSRDVDLRAVPPDSQALMVALAADELLRASWAELALRTAPPPAVPVPPAVEQVVEDAVRPPRRASVRLGVGVAGVVEHYSAGSTLLGADARATVTVAPRVSLAARFGLRTGPTVTAADGAVASTAVGGGLAAEVTVTRPEDRWELGGVADLGVEHLSVVPTAHEGATGTALSGYAVIAGAGVQGGVRISRVLRVRADVLAVVPLRPVYVADAHTNVGGVAGAGVVAAVGLWSMF